KLLAVPELRARYLANVREIAEESLDWKTLGPQIAKMRKQILTDVKADTRKLASFDEFLAATATSPPEKEQSRHMPLRTFAEKRRAYLLKAVDQKPTQK
ncbi:MAG: hypothetical protein KDA84_26165, partial [Planctomycetaceae bacterium]|nr:hypothetical protein [Planctomycetaceae bacterium]